MESRTDKRADAVRAERREAPAEAGPHRAGARAAGRGAGRVVRPAHPARVRNAFVSGSRAGIDVAAPGSAGHAPVRRARVLRPVDGPTVVPACRPRPRPRPATADSLCVPPHRSRLGRSERRGGARRLAGETRLGVADRLLVGIAAVLASAAAVVVLGLLADLAGAR
ncbi:hypothetical protein GCM10009836_43310 [Pseudonocardia ailaonensis]|uniref:Uncharacterized protein n=1 Tax=Pseudonocardia ailaonensis TaxID=367279 RepID=A0ABN2N9B3_9PSEU